jgi:hypothetical protein
MNDESKSIFASTTFWGVVVMFASQLSGRFGYTVPGDITGTVNDLAGIAGTLMALYGRLTATQMVHVLPPAGGGNQRGFANLRMLALLVFLASIALLSGCAQAQTVADPGTNSPAAVSAKSAGFDLGKLPIAKFTHADLLGAAAYANGNGYPARAAVYTAIEQQLTACEQAIDAALPRLPPAGTGVGVFTAYEIAAEAVGSGIPAAVKINCGAIVLP